MSFRNFWEFVLGTFALPSAGRSPSWSHLHRTRPGSSESEPITWITLLLSWTMFGWIAALVWAFNSKPAEQVQAAT
ncbi:superinfection immunity protein [Amycolatopsis thermophila]|uniref:Superinfection immunity protein n=1 Tax=Amycolatopsis thermophila TaxID=206084 RepID=A0ABU0ELM5_9PSEU|nr:superinfection immunity protein [Amycolatopsis thermophila]MDQ0376190.1 hypothetical protein [Amycolatopsis thermophila]